MKKLWYYSNSEEKLFEGGMYISEIIIYSKGMFVTWAKTEVLSLFNAKTL